MSLPMIHVYLPTKTESLWMTISDVVNTMDKVEWFDNFDGWESERATVMVNGVVKESTVYLSEDDRGWVSYRDFYPQLG